MRPTALFALSLAFGVCSSRAARADDPKPVVPVPAMATADQAKAALETFKKEIRDPSVDVKTGALEALAKTQHPSVTVEIAKHLTDRNLDVKTVASMVLGDQRALPGLAGQRLVASFDANTSDWIYLMKAVDSVTSLEYRGSLPALLKLLKHKNGAVVKAALVTLGDLKEIRALDAILELLKGTKIDQGAKWEGGEVKVDTGAPGDADQKAAEAAYHAKYGAKGGGKGGSGGRKTRDIGEVLLLTLKDITGEQFSKSQQVKDWVGAHKADIEKKTKALDEIQKKQDADAQAQLESIKK